MRHTPKTVGAMLAAGVLALTTLPVAVQAQSAKQSPPSDTDTMKGPPNANGYGRSVGIDKTTPNVGTDGTQSKAQAPSATNLKGPPNANGYGH